MQTASIHTFNSGKQVLTIFHTDESIPRKHFFPRFDLSDLTPIPNEFYVSYKQERQFIRALKSIEGQAILNKLKNDKSNVIINNFVENVKKDIPKKEGRSKLIEFFDEIIKEPLQGTNKLRGTSIGLTKIEIYNAFVTAGLIK